MLLVIELNAQQPQFTLIMTQKPVECEILSGQWLADPVEFPEPRLKWCELPEESQADQFALYVYDHQQPKQVFNTLGILPPHSISDHYRQLLRQRNYRELLVELPLFAFAEGESVTMLLDVQEE